MLLRSSEEKNDSYVEDLPNIKVHSLPVLKFDFINGPKLVECINSADKYCGLVLTSARSVEALHHHCNSTTTLLQQHWAVEKPAFVVGEATKSKLLQLLPYWRHIYGWDSGTSKKLADVVMQETKPGTTLLFPCGNLKMNDLTVEILKNDIFVQEVVCYETKRHMGIQENLMQLQKNIGSHLLFVVFFSPSGVEFALEDVLKQFGEKIHLKVVAIGPTTEKALREKGMEEILTARKPNSTAIKELIFDNLKD